MATHDNAPVPVPQERCTLWRPPTLHGSEAMPESSHACLVGRLSQDLEHLASSRPGAFAHDGGRSPLSFKTTARRATFVVGSGGHPMRHVAETRSAKAFAQLSTARCATCVFER